jgi:protein-tyrosine phosphatase
MIDLHSHILPHLDDGAQSVEEAIEMARFYVADGITDVVATPHCHRYIHLLKREILPRVDEFHERLAAAAIALNVLPGSEIQVTDSEAYRKEFDAGVYCHLGGGTTFTLLEFNWNRELFPSDAGDLIRWLCKQGTTPILAHPERHDFFWDEPSRLERLADAGAWIQVTVDSLLGNHGPSPSMAAESILLNYKEVVLATDAHNLGRCSGLSAGYQWVKEHIDEAKRVDLFNRAEFIHSRIRTSA